MSFLEINYSPYESSREKQVRIISLEQVIGEQLHLHELQNDIKVEFNLLVSQNPEKFHIEYGRRFTVIGPNGTPITYANNGRSPWFFIRGIKDERKQLAMLLIGKSLWGLEINTGLRIKKSIEKYGREKMREYLHKQILSILFEPHIWKHIQGYCV